MNYLFGQIARCVPPSSLRGSPTDKSEIPIWFPQSNVTKSNVTKPLLQIGFLTHWKEKSGILVRRLSRATAGLLIFTQFCFLEEEARLLIFTLEARLWHEKFKPIPRICEKNIFRGFWWRHIFYLVKERWDHHRMVIGNHPPQDSINSYNYIIRATYNVCLPKPKLNLKSESTKLKESRDLSFLYPLAFSVCVVLMFF